MIWLALACSDFRSKGLPHLTPERLPLDTGHVEDSDEPDDTGEPIEESLVGWIGSPCDTVDDCDYEGAICLTEGFPRGTCSMDCELYCPDEDGFPLTFCVEEPEFPNSAPIGDGGCLSRCDFGAYPDTQGCRQDYGCVEVARANEPTTIVPACLPNREPEIADCLTELADRGIDFEPTTVADTSPADFPELTCHIEEPVYIKSPLLGVTLRYYEGTETTRVLGSCEMAHALADTVEDVKEHGVTDLLHIGTYNCRVIADTSTLSRHAYGDAIDIYGFWFEDGSTAILEEDWDHDTSSQSSWEGQMLYDAAYRWHDNKYWNIILTPNYNSVHDNHFHVDLTPNRDSIAFWEPFFIGPNTGH
ncbi:MAG: extensin family protein [Proteobacteria bacterium]|nr:extensin family protein [Pseudomonadota bacterium]MCP4921563.1 extensin family protein [Pseudomonadota bacterium]